MSGLFPHRVIEETEGFVFLVQPSDETDEEAVAAAGAVEDILKEAWPTAPSNLTVADVTDPEEAELIYADAAQILEEAECEEANQFIITGITIAGQLVIVNCALAGEDLVDEDEEEDDDDNVEASEDDFA